MREETKAAPSRHGAWACWALGVVMSTPMSLIVATQLVTARPNLGPLVYCLLGFQPLATLLTLFGALSLPAHAPNAPRSGDTALGPYRTSPAAPSLSSRRVWERHGRPDRPHARAAGNVVEAPTFLQGRQTELTLGARWIRPLVAALVSFVVLPAAAARAQCAEGRDVSEQTEGRCCWPGQRWSSEAARCEGAPTCPEGLASEGDACVPLRAAQPRTDAAPSAAPPPSPPERARVPGPEPARTGPPERSPSWASPSPAGSASARPTWPAS